MFVNVCRTAMPVVILAEALGVYRMAFVSADTTPPEYSSQPNQVRPLHEMPRMVTDEQLYQILRRVRPPKGPAVSNTWLHAWRLWGSDAAFADPEIPSGATMQASPRTIHIPHGEADSLTK